MAKGMPQTIRNPSGLESGNRLNFLMRRRWISVQIGLHEAAVTPLDTYTRAFGCLGLIQQLVFGRLDFNESQKLPWMRMRARQHGSTLIDEQMGTICLAETLKKNSRQWGRFRSGVETTYSPTYPVVQVTYLPQINQININILIYSNYYSYLIYQTHFNLYVTNVVIILNQLQITKESLQYLIQQKIKHHYIKLFELI
ncbi:Hypothetical_protein [Hexamita inflata]|uniref:Hypothetical_protein n=1 Tax=Hexamita inflata TaxID=28002 RepID=A0AA86RDS0_9EUKA|nr:Hypothetical protein HINF_LOCUS63380 [Hexamita inflata]